MTAIGGIPEAGLYVFTRARLTRRQRALRNYRRMHREEERKLKTKVNAWLNEMTKTLRAGLSKMRGKTPAARVRSIADWDAIRERGIELIKPQMLAALVRGGESVMGRRVRKQVERFDPIGIEAVGWATKRSGELVVEITKSTMKAIRAYIVTGVKEGKSIRKIARELRPLVGLTERQLKAVANFHEKLILDRPEWTAARQRASAEAYARRLHRRRATTIARTETALALTEGQRQGYGQMGIKRLERVEDPEESPPGHTECVDNSGRIYTLEEAAGVLPAHPNCEGSWVAAA